MARVLLIGESWMIYSVHQKGFDAFYTSEFVWGGTEFVDALRSTGHEVVHVPSHEIAHRVPSTVEELRALADVVVISDVGANSFQITRSTFTTSTPEPDKTEVIRDYVARGGALLMVGGYLTFSGIDGKARWGRTPLAEALPVDILDRDDRVELPAGAAPELATTHPITDGLDDVWPALLGLNEVAAKANSTTLAVCSGHPLLVVGEHGRGRTAAFTSDIAPHWAPPPFLHWDGYARLFDQTIQWLAKESRDA